MYTVFGNPVIYGLKSFSKIGIHRSNTRMARKRRKGEERNGDNAKQRRKDQPLDTNAEILPAKPTAINTPLVSFPTLPANLLRVSQRAESLLGKSESA